MSRYEDYDRTSKSYDETRFPVGVEIILGCFARATVPLHEQRILDAGCGTGSYVDAIRRKVGRAFGLDQSAGMLECARAKMGSDPRVDFRRGSVVDLPYADGSFDGVMCNQVLHHLESGDPAAGFPGLVKFIAEARRVLGVGGILVINTSSHRQLRDGFWWAELASVATERIAARFAPLETVERALQDAGFELRGRIAPLTDQLQRDHAADPRALLDKKFRDGDSLWSLLDRPELDDVLARLTAKIEDGSIGAYVAQRNALRLECGQCTFIHARRPAL